MHRPVSSLVGGAAAAAAAAAAVFFYPPQLQPWLLLLLPSSPSASPASPHAWDLVFWQPDPPRTAAACERQRSRLTRT